MAFYKDLPLSRLLAYAVQHKENYRFAGFLRNVTQKKSPDSISSEWHAQFNYRRYNS